MKKSNQFSTALLTLLFGQTIFADVSVKTLTCSNIQLSYESFEQCKTNDSTQHGGTQFCASEKMNQIMIDKMVLNSNALGLNDTVTAQIGNETFKTICEKDYIGGQEEVVCKLTQNITVTYLPSSFEFNDYNLAFFLGSKNQPSATASHRSSNCNLVIPLPTEN